MPIPDKEQLKDTLVKNQSNSILDTKQEQPSDIQFGKVPEVDIPDEELIEYLVSDVRSILDSRSRVSIDGSTFEDRIIYDLKAYYGIKDEFLSNFPHPRASNFPVPITPVFVDVGKSNILNSMYRNPLKTVNVNGISPEDTLYNDKVSSVINWEVGVESNMYEVQNTNAFRTFLNGTGFVKTWADLMNGFKIRNVSVPMRNILKSPYGTGCQVNDCPSIHEIIPLHKIEMQHRKNLTIDGKKVYRNLENVMAGYKLERGLNEEELRAVMSQISGVDYDSYDSKNMYFLVESHFTYYPEGSMRARQLVVVWSPNGGFIHRKIENEDGIRTYSDYYIYEINGMAYHLSLPQKIRHIQEKANYTDKQKVDARDKAISRKAYIEKGSGFDPDEYVSVLGGMYEVEKGTNITYEPVELGSIFSNEKELDVLWEQAKLVTSMNDLYLGGTPERRLTATTDRIRTAKAENRFEDILNVYGLGWKETCELTYFYIDKYMPRNKMIRILGSSEYQNLGQMFPSKDLTVRKGFGLKNAKFDFSLAGKTQTKQAEEDLDVLEQTGEILTSPFGQDKAVAWRCLQIRAQIRGFKEFTRILPKPPEADFMGVEEILQRIESGEIGLQPSSFMSDNVLLEYQIYRFNAFKLSERYKNYTLQKKVEMERYIKNLKAILANIKLANLESQAKDDPEVAQILDEISEEVALSAKNGGNGNGQVVTP